MPSDTDQSVKGANDSAPPANALAPPTISLPKGGGAIRGIGEKFAANAVTGTGSLSVPIAVSPGRSGFGPQLTLAYDSGTGNGPFGIGCTLSLPTITRRTDKGIPQYRDTEESDVFILSGAEDLVPVFEQDCSGERTLDEFLRDGYSVKRYRPRIEGLFARIERWTRVTDGDVHWRSISKDNILTVYGRSAESRIADPANPSHVFSWLVCQSYDDKGNAIVYEYVAENGDCVDLSKPNERNRVRTAQRYLKRIRYGNRRPLLIDPATPSFRKSHLAIESEEIAGAGWMFEVIFDYEEAHYRQESPDGDGWIFAHATATQKLDSRWSVRSDPFSNYRSGFEVRTYRSCRRVLMFHCFPEELGVDHCLVRSTEFEYDAKAIGSFITRVIQSGYTRQADGRYLKRSLPPLDLTYTSSPLEDPTYDRYQMQEVDAASLENLPGGIDGGNYRWVDLDGEGISGVLTEQGGAWFYKHNLGRGRFGSVETVTPQPSLAALGSGRQQLMDVAGDGNLDLVDLSADVAGFYERTTDARWQRLRTFPLLPICDWNDPNLRLVDVTGDGVVDILVTEGDALTWHPSLLKEGFGTAVRVRVPEDEEKGPRVLFADGTQSIYLADMSGDGLSDIVRIRNGEVCYWPNMGYGRFGAKVTMDRAPWLDEPDQFDQRRIRLADTDGSGTTDIVYLSRDAVRIFLNEVGNGWSSPRFIRQFPTANDAAAISVVDFLGRGTACLLWSSPLPGDSRRPLRYVDLMAGQKPHLLTRIRNNLGAETVTEYASSTEFYLADKAAGTPWLTRLPFPVHVVKRVDTYDWISRNRFVSRYTYHHGYFDGVEREFRGFGRVDQLDTEDFAALTQSGHFPTGDNIDAASHVPPVLTKTWFHTGAFLTGRRLSRQFEREYYLEGDPRRGEAALCPEDVEAMLLDDTTLPAGSLTANEAREACRSLKGSILRQEVYAVDGREESSRPYTVSECSYTIRLLQRHRGNRHSVFFVHPREELSCNYERKLYDIAGRRRADPRVMHTVTLRVDDYGNVLESVAVCYGRRFHDQAAILSDTDHAKQHKRLLTLTETRYTNPVRQSDAYRIPLLSEARLFELINLTPLSHRHGMTNLFRFYELAAKVTSASDGVHDLPYEDLLASGAIANVPHRRLIDRSRRLYRANRLDRMLPLGSLESLALPGASYNLAFTPGLLKNVYQRATPNQPLEDLLPDPDKVLAQEGGYVDLDGNGHWWVPSGAIFYSPNADDSATSESHVATRRFFLPQRFRDPFGNVSTLQYDTHDLALIGTRDALGNTTHAQHDYRVLLPRLMTDSNGNRSEVAFDALGLVAGSALMGKVTETLGDSLHGFKADLTSQQLQSFLSDPKGNAAALLGAATTRLVYDLDRYFTSQEPAFGAALGRETHVSDLAPNEQTKLQVSFSYSDGFGREIQKKLQAEPGPLVEGGPEATPRWVGSGWTIFNNKTPPKPVRRYEPFFSATHAFEFGNIVGVSAVLFYDPVERVVGTLHPNHTYEKVVFDPWRQDTWDVNDTVIQADPERDPDVGQYFAPLPDSDYLPTWYERREQGALGSDERAAATKAAAHANTPTVAYFDPLGRAYLTVPENRFRRKGADISEYYPTRVELDIEGNQRDVIDATDRVVMRYEYDMLGNRIRASSMDAGERWMLSDAVRKPLYAWDSRLHQFRTAYDALRRPTESYARAFTTAERLIKRSVYGETHPTPEASNLRGKVAQLFDQAGVVTSVDYDFKGNLLHSDRQLALEYKTTLDWSAAIPLAMEIYASRISYDALNRVQAMTLPEGSVIRHAYGEGALLKHVEAHLRRETSGDEMLTQFVANIIYNAKGQRILIDYGNGARTTYDYDPQTFRLVHLLTCRGLSTVCTERVDSSRASSSDCQIQNLRYTYDPTGNITHIRDDAQQTIYFRNRRVDPSAAYTYDAIYRLIEATGREHLGQTGSVSSSSPYDAPRVGLLHPGDGNAMGRYIERYVYDAVANVQTIVHHGEGPGSPVWVRAYTYDEHSQLAPGKRGNRLTRTAIAASTESYSTDGDGYDAHGNMLRMPHLRVMQWDFNDQLQMSERQEVNDSDDKDARRHGERTWYVYDATGQRVRKIIETIAGQVKYNRTYLGGLDLDRAYGPKACVRATLHIMDNKERVALVEMRTHGDEANPAEEHIRYQLGNHLGSSCIELDNQAQISSYEEYAPYGSTSYQAVRSRIETPKRYRYIGKERDGQSGFYYLGARYYIPWIARWASADPAGLVDGTNPYVYARDNPVRLSDPNGLQSSPGNRVVALGRSTIEIPGAGEYAFSEAVVQYAAEGTGLRPVTFSDLLRSPEVSANFSSVHGGGLPPGYRGLPSGALLQQVLEGATPVYLTTTGVDVLSDTHTSSELRQLITHLSTESNEHADIYIQEGNAVSRIPRGTSIVEGAPLPERIEQHLPPSFRRAPPSGTPSAAPSTPAPLETAPVSTSAQAPTSATSGRSGASPVGPWTTFAGNTAANLTRGLVPGVIESEIGLAGAAVYAHAAGYTAVGAALETGAAAVPVVGASLLVGGIVGNVAEAGVRQLGASDTVAQGTGAVAAMAAGAGVGALIGAPIGGITAVPGAIIGGAVGLAGYYLSKLL